MTFPEKDLCSDVAKAVHEVVRPGRRRGLSAADGSQRASVVATDGAVADGPCPGTTEVLGAFA